jgi:hypothetical protein
MAPRPFFWQTSWLNGRRPKDIAPSIFVLSKMKNFCVKKGLQEDYWINTINTSSEFSVQHIREFYDLWVLGSECDTSRAPHQGCAG